MRRKQVDIEYSCYEGYNIGTSNNGSQWNVVYTDKDYKKAMSILNAFKKVGYDDVTDYEDLEVHDVSHAKENKVVEDVE